jgi:hypothetical protein
MVKAKYGITHGIWRVKMKASDSSVWKIPLKIKDIYLRGRKMVVGNGESVDFWHDSWCGNTSLVEQFPFLYEFFNQLTITIRELCERNWNITFRRWLDPELKN